MGKDCNNIGEELESHMVITSYGVVTLRRIRKPNGQIMGLYDLSMLPMDRAQAFMMEYA